MIKNHWLQFQITKDKIVIMLGNFNNFRLQAFAYNFMHFIKAFQILYSKNSILIF